MVIVWVRAHERVERPTEELVSQLQSRPKCFLCEQFFLRKTDWVRPICVMVGYLLIYMLFF